MAHHKSAIKRIKQNIERRARNRAVMSATRTKIKRLRVAIENGEKDGIRAVLMDATRALHKAVSKGVIPRKRASRLTARLTKHVNRIEAS